METEREDAASNGKTALESLVLPISENPEIVRISVKRLSEGEHRGGCLVRDPYLENTKYRCARTSPLSQIAV